MDRRRDRRWPRQLDVRLWMAGQESAFPAVASNISRSGIFVRTNQVVPSGSRMRVEVIHGPRGFVAEAVVVRALRAAAHLQSVQPSGMGLRFLTAEELVEELLPGALSTAEEEVAGSTRAGTIRSEPLSPEEMVLESPQSAVPPPPAPSPGQPPGAPAPSQRMAPPTDRLFRIGYRSREQFRRVFERDIKTGGLFVPAASPAGLDQVIQIEVSIDESTSLPVTVEARVVHRMEPTPGSETDGNLLVGMGVQFTDIPRAMATLAVLLRT